MILMLGSIVMTIVLAVFLPMIQVISSLSAQT
jgi:type II secretory pathway component PulF